MVENIIELKYVDIRYSVVTLIYQTNWAIMGLSLWVARWVLKIYMLEF